jgi:hypothetical protein
MNLTALCKHYFKYYDRISDTSYRLADNAPREWQQFVNTLPPIYRKFAPIVLIQIIERIPYPPLPLDTYLDFVRDNPSWIAKADAIMSQKTPTKSFVELLDKIYRAELKVTKDIITNYLNDLLTS